MTDLQCPARVFVARPGEDGRRLGQLLVHERIAHVYATVGERENGEAAAGVLGVAASGRDEGDLDGLADQHRGEAVLLLGHELPDELGGPVQQPYVVVEGDASGWRLG